MAHKKKHPIRTAACTMAVIIVLGALATASYFFIIKSSETVYNDLPNANGNTPGNLSNGGLFATADGTVYFSNPLDQGCLYKMNKDETVATKLSGETVYSLNVYGNYIYYAKNNLNDSNSSTVLRGSLVGAARCDLDGSHILELNDRYTGQLTLIGNSVYFQDFENDREAESTTSTIQKKGIDGKEGELVSKETIACACTIGKVIYYSDPEDHCIYALNTASKSASLVAEGNYWLPIVYGYSELYYLDLEHNYALVKSSVNNSDNKTTLVEERISTYNVSDTYIYFQIDDGDNSKLCRIRRDGSDPDYEVIAEGSYENINLTPNYVYFAPFQRDDDAYRTPLNGPVRVERLSDVLTLEKPSEK